MFKLIFLTLVGFVAVLFVFGDGDGRRVEIAAPAPVETVVADVPSAATAVADTVAVNEVEQTETQAPEFPGPELRPSPEYAGETPAEDLAEAPTDTLYVTGNSVNFRSGPSTSDGVVGRLTRGQMVTAVGARSGDWVEIRDGQGRTGFMSAQFLSASRP